MHAETRIPHHLRLTIFFMRLAAGLDLFYLGWTSLFNQALGAEIAKHSLGSMYEWIFGAGGVVWIQWTLLFVGVALILGFATRLAAAVALGLVLASLWPNVAPGHFALWKLASDEILVGLSLLVVFFGKAGKYIGLDAFFHFSLRHPKQK